MSTSDYFMLNEYKNMFGFNNINSVSNNTIFIGNTTINSDLNVNNNTIFNNPVILNSNLQISKGALINNANFQKNLNINNNLVSKNPITYLSNFNANYMIHNSNLHIDNNAVITNISILSSLMINNSGSLNNLYTTNIYPLNQQIKLSGNNIYIGNPNSIVNIYGTSVNIMSSEIEIINKNILLNYNTNNSGIDNGNLCGIKIYGNNNIGYISTTTDVSRFQIKAPNDNKINYILPIDLNYNIIISGNTILQNNITTLNNLTIKQDAILNNISIVSNLYVSGSSFLSDVNTNTNYISGNTFFNNSVFANNGFFTGKNILNTITINSIINSNSITLQRSTILSNLITSSPSQILFNNNATINSNLNFNTTIFNNEVTVGSNLYMNNIFISGNTNIGQNLYVDNTSILNTSNVLNNLTISGNTNIVGSITLNSNLTTNLNIIMPLLDYKDNYSAYKSGIPLWGFYRTGGIVKICIDNIPPNLQLIGDKSVYIKLGDSYIDQGVIVTDNLEQVTPYIVSIIDTIGNQYISIPLQITGMLDLSSIINMNQITNYIITYAAMDSFGNIAIKTRNLIISYPKSNSYETTNGNLQLTNLNFNALNNTDWTCEAWILITYNNGPVAIFDFRQPNNGNAYLPPNHFWLEINNFKPVIQAMSNRNLIGSSITTTIPLNKWTHVVWMRKNNIFYTFINGLPSPGETVPSYLNSLSGLQYMVHGVYANLIYNNSTSGHLNGQINQPLITLGAKYNTSGFTVRWILYPPDLTNVLYHLIEDIDLISNQNIIKNRSIIINIITSDPLVPIMKLIGGNTVNLLLGNPYTDLGVTITDYFGTTITSYNLIGSVDSNTLGLYLLTYSATDNRSSTINQIRYVYVNNSTVYSSLFFWIDPSDLNTINYNNTSIVSITDKSGTNIVLTQYTSTSIPQLKLNGINGLPVLDLTNSSSLKSINTYANSYNVTLAVVVTFFQTTNWGVIWGHFNNHDSDITLRNTAGSVYINRHRNNDNSNVQIPYIANTPVLYLATLTNGTSRWLQVINLITGNTNTISGTNSLTMTLANCPFYLGSSEVTSELALCYIGECMYWKRVLNGSELLQVKSYLYNKWSLNNIKNFNIYSPVISLIGNATVYIYNGSVFNDLGAIASDYQGNTLEYSTSGYVNISINDTYIVTYTVSTIYGTTSIQRNVIVY